MTIVIATFNRPDALAFALRSVQAQTVTDWECLVIGDACTDNTGEVVARCSDPRMQFENLPRNLGDQSGPNNHGCTRARGRFIAFLNHDDLWLPDHLETCLATLEATAADLVVPVLAFVDGDGTVRWVGMPPGQGYEPNLSLPASAWVFRRELVAAVGPWRRRHECYNMPSQDWIFRAWKSGKRIAGIPQITAIALPSGSRRDSYLRGAAEQAEWWRRIGTEPDLRRQLAVAIAAHAHPPPSPVAAAPRVPYWRRTPAHWLRTLRHFGWAYGLCLIRWGAPKLGWHPKSVEYFFRYRRRGGFVDALRRWRGLDTPPSRSADIKKPVA